MNILYVGSGYVGTCSAAVSADSGHNVLVYDIDQNKINDFASLEKDRIESCLYEDGLYSLILKNKERLSFVSDLEKIKLQLDDLQAIFMCLPTPEKDQTGETDLSYYEKAVSELAKFLKQRNQGSQSRYVLIVNKSTVPLGMISRAKEILDSLGVENYGLGSNPEFLVEGNAIEGSIRPQRVVVGAWQEKDFIIFREIYKRFSESPNTSYIEVNPIEAEAGKLLANFILFNRTANCFDVVGRTCEQYGDLHFENVRKVLISDKRIGNWGFYDSLFAGGSCYIKDARSLSHQLKQKGAATNLIDDTLEANRRQLDIFVSRPEKELGYSWHGRKAALLGLAFKRDTNDIRNSGAIGVADYLLSKGVKEIRAYDPVANHNFQKYYQKEEKIIFFEKASEALKDSEVIVIAADWPEFREYADIIIKNFKGDLIMDGRRMLQHEYGKLKESGYKIIAVGSATIK